MKFLVCGEGLIDLIRQHDGSWIAHNGGGPLNTAKALSKLGCEVDFLARLSTDPFGQQLRADLNSTGLLGNTIVHATEPTSLAVVTVSETGSADYSFYLEHTSNFSWQIEELPTSLSDYDLLHIGTLAIVVEPGASVLGNWIDQRNDNSLIMIDLNVRPSVIRDQVEYLNRLTPWLNRADIIKASDEDLFFLYQTMTSQEVVAELFNRTKVELIAVTHGSKGATLFTRERQISAAAPAVHAVDTVGAGDTFSAGLLRQLANSGLLAKENLSQASAVQLGSCLNYAVAAAALSCTKPGAHTPSEQEVMSLIDAS